MLCLFLAVLLYIFSVDVDGEVNSILMQMLNCLDAINFCKTFLVQAFNFNYSASFQESWKILVEKIYID